ncbi:MAG: proton-conducting transporter membrane subunit [Lautropia sp.]
MIGPHLLLTLPVAIPLCAAALCAMLWRRPPMQRAVSLAASLALLAASLALLAATADGTVLTTRFGSWPAPFAIVFVGDLLSTAMVVITGVMAVAVAVYGLVDGAREREQALFHPLYHGLLLGVTGAFLTGDLFNLYVWFEVMLIASFGLLVQDGTRAQLDAGIKYVVLNLLATTLFLMAIAFLYGLTGSLNMADLAITLPTVENRGLVVTLAVMFLFAFGAKAAVFPLFFWLPAAYHTATAPVVAIFAALLTKVGVYALLRSFTLIFAPELGTLGPAIGVIAGATMVTGVLGAAAHFDVRRILSFHIISQIGYMLVGLAVATPLAIAGSVLYVIHHIVVKANLFLVGGAIRLAGGSTDLARIGGLYRRAPLLAILFAIPALSLAGVPPLSGFWAKFVVVRSSLEAGHVALAAIALVVGLLTLYSMAKIWNEAFWKAPSEPEAAASATVAPTTAPTAAPTLPTALPPAAALQARWYDEPRTRIAMIAPIAALASITLTIGLSAEWFVDYAMRAAEQMLSTTTYVEAVLEGTRPATARLELDR